MKKDRFPSKKQNRKYKKDLIINCLFLEEENHLPSEENMKKAYDIAKQFSSSGASILFQTELQKNIFNDGIAKGMIEHMKNEPSI